MNKYIIKKVGIGYAEEKTLKEIFRGFANRILHWFAMTRLPITSKARVTLHRLRGVAIGDDVFIGGACFLDSARPELILIADGVFLSGGVSIIAHSRPPDFLSEFIKYKAGKVYIKKGSWIGYNSTILPGITIGEGSIVGAGSVVTKDVPPYIVVAGNPAKKIRNLKDD